MEKRTLVIITVLLVLFASMPRILAQPIGCAKYYGDILVPNTNSSIHLKSVEADVYELHILAKINGNGLFDLIDHNSTFNAVLINGNNVTFVLRKSSPIYKPASQGNTTILRSASNLTEYGLVGPFLVKVFQEKILEVSITSSTLPSIELLEAKVGEEAQALVEGKKMLGLWYDGFEGWIFHLNWTGHGNLSTVIIYKNGTAVPFYRILRASSSDISSNISKNKTYRWIHISISNGMIELDARSRHLLAAKQVNELPIKEFFCFYKYNSSTFLTQETRLKHLSYFVVSPEKCETCTIGKTIYTLDTNFKMNIRLNLPSEGIGGSTIPITVSLPKNITNAILYVPGGKAVVLRGLEVPYRLMLPLPLISVDKKEEAYLTVRSENGIYGLKRPLEILRSYEAKLLNRTQVFLIGGKGNLHISVANFARESISLIDAQMNLTTRKGEIISLRFPLSINLQGNSSQRIILPLNLPIGDYEAVLSLNLRNQTGHISTLYLGKVSIISTGRDPMNTLLTVSPGTPNAGDNVQLKVMITNIVPLSEILVSTNVSSNLEPISETSKLLKDVPEGSTKKMVFLFKAKSIGPAKISVLFYYKIRGENFQRLYSKEVKVPIGGVSGRAFVDISKSEIRPGEKVTIDVRVEDISGNLTVEFPKEMAIIEANGRIKRNSVESDAPGRVRIIGTFKEGGEYAIPTYIIVNRSLLVPSNTVTIKVLGENNMRYLEKSLRSKLADLLRRYKTLKETSGGLSPDEKKRLDSIGRTLEEIEILINKGYYAKASEMLSNVEDEISSMEEHAFSSLDQIMSSFIYFLIGAGIASAFLLVIRLRRGRKHGS